MKIKLFATIALVIGALIVGLSTAGINDAGYRTVVQYPSGKLWVKQDPGLYFIWFGRTTVYPDFLTYDFSAQDGACSFKNADGTTDGIKVRYQDGGEGSVCGLARVSLPNSEAQMLEVHKAYRDEAGLRSKLLGQVFPKAVNLTSALMSSEEAYATKRSEFIQLGQDQAIRGIYQTRLVTKTFEAGLDETGAIEYQEKEVPEPVMGTDGQFITNGSDFDKYGIIVEQFDLNAWDFEQKTLNQIGTKREAEMATVTAKANADRAYYEQLQAEAEGKKRVTEAEYAELEKAKREIVNSDKEREIAVIAANRTVLVAAEKVKRAEQEVLEQEQLALAAQEEAKRITTIADAEAYAKEAIIEADNALAQKLATEEKIQQVWAEAYARRAVPSSVTVLGGSSGGTGGTTVAGDSEVSNFLKILTAEAANNLNYERNVSKKGKN